MNYPLLNGAEMATAYPATFEVPTSEEISAIEPGDYVKIGFIGDMTERMWVEVIEPGKGILNNDPVVVDMICGDPVSYEPYNILSIFKKGSL